MNNIGSHKHIACGSFIFLLHFNLKWVAFQSEVTYISNRVGCIPNWSELYFDLMHIAFQGLTTLKAKEAYTE